MKKIFFLLLFSVTALAATAQGPMDRITFGAHAGWSVSNISGNHFEAKSGFTGGVSATLRMGGNFYIQPEVNFQQQGAKYVKEFIIGDVVYRDAQLNMSYLQVPLLLKYRIAPANLSIYAGPQVGFKLSAKEYIDGGSYNYESNNVRNTDFSGTYGLEYFFWRPDENVAFVLNARHFIGFTNFANYSYANMPDNSYQNHGFVFSLGLRF
ncbi:Outer membrane protein beta-barrel domain-containing protein [Fodinibius roseus]|uniref:Outer membrane protein beta-barrel domain-containing protein n=1 Tax=Fodinibius roseus TaxID=1194090 RepID=A0A1M5EIL8_9BACT|nr:porin family protein [Fodinibius roseus]SHF79108.1 Outer membrane protein beta-barrel domain-containing protein [Fodinibius roseus]